MGTNIYFCGMRGIRWYHILGVLLAAKLLLHLYLNGQLSFHRDELLYLALGRRMDWGFASVPPGIAFWAWVGDNLPGGSVEGIRLISTLSGTAAVLLTMLMAKEMLPGREGSGRFAAWVVGLAGLTCGAFLRPSMLFQPVVFDLFYWTLLSWLFLKYLNTEKSSWLLWFGAVTGLALLNKYSVLIFLFGMLPGLLFARSRRIFSQLKFYMAAGLALLLILPNILWQAEHKFPLFRHIGGLAATQFVHVTPGGFLGDQLTFFLPALPVWMAGLYFLMLRKEAAPWRIFGWMFITVLVVLLLFSAKSYYSLGAYPVLVAAGAAFGERLTAEKRRGLRIALVAFMLLMAIISIPVSLPLLPPEQEARLVQRLTVAIPGLRSIQRWEDGNYYALPQDYADMIGWEELGRRVGEVWQSLPDKDNSAVYAENYGQAGAIEHFGKPYDVPDVWCFSDNYRYWLPGSLPADFHTLIYINSELGDDMPGFFQKIEKVWELDLPLSRQHGNQIYRCEGPTPAFFERVGSAVQQAADEETIE